MLIDVIVLGVAGILMEIVCRFLGLEFSRGLRILFFVTVSLLWTTLRTLFDF